LFWVSESLKKILQKLFTSKENETTDDMRRKPSNQQPAV